MDGWACGVGGQLECGVDWLAPEGVSAPRSPPAAHRCPPATTPSSHKLCSNELRRTRWSWEKGLSHGLLVHMAMFL